MILHHHRRRWAVLLLLLLLPWLFLGEMPRAVQGQDAGWSLGILPVPVPVAKPLPASAPLALQYWPVPIPVLQRWIEDHYPGALAGQPAYRGVLQAALTAARRWNLNPLLLLGVLGQEQSFLSPDVAGGMAHALHFTANPWDYGVWPGSPFRFAIGPTASAMGAAGILVRTIDGVLASPQRFSWTTLELATARAYLGSNASAAALMQWADGVFSIWHEMATDPVVQAGITVATLQNPSEIPVAARTTVLSAIGGATAGLPTALMVLRQHLQDGATWLSAHLADLLTATGMPPALVTAIGGAVAAVLGLLSDVVPAIVIAAA